MLLLCHGNISSDTENKGFLRFVCIRHTVTEENSQTLLSQNIPVLIIIELCSVLFMTAKGVCGGHANVLTADIIHILVTRRHTLWYCCVYNTIYRDCLWLPHQSLQWECGGGWEWSGYTLEGVSMRTCQNSAAPSWSGSPPSCNSELATSYRVKQVIN